MKLIFFILLAFSVVYSNTTDVRNCFHKGKKIENVVITDCEDERCLFLEDTKFNVHQAFSPEIDVQSAVPYTRFYIGSKWSQHSRDEGHIKFMFRLDKPDLLQSRPFYLEKGGKYSISIDIQLTNFPREAAFTIEVSLVNEQTAEWITCFHFDVVRIGK